MRSSHSLDRIDIAFDGSQLVADAGLMLPATLAHHLGLRELVNEHLHLGRKPGATGQLTMRADSGFYAHAVVSTCRTMGVRFSITIRQHRSVRRLIEAIPETDWTPIPYCNAG